MLVGPTGLPFLVGCHGAQGRFRWVDVADGWCAGFILLFTPEGDLKGFCSGDFFQVQVFVEQVAACILASPLSEINI